METAVAVLLIEAARRDDTFDDVEDFSDWAANPLRDNLGQDVEETITEALSALGGRRVIEL